MNQPQFSTPVQATDVADLLDRERATPFIAENPGDQITGKVVRYEVGESRFGPADIAIIATPKDGEKAFWLLGAALKSQWGKAAPKPGETVGAKFLGDRVSAAGNRYKDWRVVVDRPEALPNFDAMAEEVEL
jgi:hypothetical protein